ncbi:TonB-dependent receptor domain-containing protein [Chitinophaga sp. 22620]|uniref:TonB-dependent receptor domain-containing protein n=1 Tax=Chitinophaga sp. 22620 TaxID=3453952 RepID=UPI003F870E85
MMKKLMICCLLAFHFTAQAQTTLKGKVTDEQTGLGVGFVSVSLLSLPDSGLVKGQISDSAGLFTFSDVKSGRYTLLLAAMGYRKLYRPVNGSANLGNIPLSPDASLLDGVTVTGERAAMQMQGDKLVVNISGNKLFNASTNAFDILKKLPNLEVGADGAILMAGRVAPGVFIDGKPSPMSPEELQNYLASLSPSMISSIEVISNPSGRYDGEHKGIIDIRLKRDQTLGWQGTATLSLQQNQYTLNENNLAVTYKTKKLAYTARLGYTTGNTVRHYDALQHQANTNIMTTNTRWLTGNNNPSIQLGADYNIHKDHKLELLLRTYQVRRDLALLNTLDITDASGEKPVSFTNSDNYSSPRQDNYAANLNYSGRLGKTQLDVLGSLVKIMNRQDEDIRNRDAFTGNLKDHWKTILKNDILIRALQADLTRNAGKGKLSAGAKFALSATENDLRYDTLNTAGEFVLDNGRTNSFRYDEYITAGYAAYEGSISKFGYTASLRVENTHSVANSYTEKQVTKRNYLAWLPSLSLTYAFHTNEQLNLSFSRRVTRPNFAQLNPFRMYISPLNYFIGNPFLQPSTTTQLSLTYSLRSLSVALRAGRESDPMTRYPEYDSVTNILQYLGTNLPYNDFAGIEVSFPVTVSKWWRMNHNIRGGYKKEQTPYHGVTYAIPITDYSVSGSQVFTLPAAVTLDVSYFYKSRSGSGLYIHRPLSSVDIGLQKTWLKGKLNSKLNVYDIFDDYRVKYIFREKQILNNELQHWFGNRRVVAALTFNFGSSTHKTKQSSRSDEENRAM